MSSRQNDVGGTEYAAAIAAQQPEKSSLSPVQEEATPTLDAATERYMHYVVSDEKGQYCRKCAKRDADLYDGGCLLSDDALDVQERLNVERTCFLLEKFATEETWLTDKDIADLGSLASALPTLLEASRNSYWNNFVATCEELAVCKTELAGSISERETLTAQNAELQKMLEQERRAHGG